MKPLFVVLEGIDAAGKGTQAEILARRLAEISRTPPGWKSCSWYSFPRYETPLGQAILRHLQGHIYMAEERTRDSSDVRVDGDTYTEKAPEDALVLQALMLADKVDAAAHIRARGEDGEHVVADRWWQSALIYGAADELDPDWLRRLGQGLPQADLNILVDISFEESMRRRPERRDRYERDVEKQKKIVSAYREMWKSARRSDWAIVDGAESEVAVAESIWALVARRLIGGA